MKISKRMKKEIDSFGISCYHYMPEIQIIYRARNEKAIQRVRPSYMSHPLYKHQLKSLGNDILKDFLLHVMHYKTATQEETK